MSNKNPIKKARCVEASPGVPLTNGRVYDVRVSENDEMKYELMDDEGDENTFFRWRFEPLESNENDPYAGHTPGPWTAEQDAPGYDTHYYIAAGVPDIAKVFGENAAANARLIAAAPELLRENQAQRRRAEGAEQELRVQRLSAEVNLEALKEARAEVERLKAAKARQADEAFTEQTRLRAELDEAKVAVARQHPSIAKFAAMREDLQEAREALRLAHTLLNNFVKEYRYDPEAVLKHSSNPLALLLANSNLDAIAAVLAKETP